MLTSWIFRRFQIQFVYQEVIDDIDGAIRVNEYYNTGNYS